MLLGTSVLEALGQFCRPRESHNASSLISDRGKKQAWPQAVLTSIDNVCKVYTFILPSKHMSFLLLIYVVLTWQPMTSHDYVCTLDIASLSSCATRQQRYSASKLQTLLDPEIRTRLEAMERTLDKPHVMKAIKDIPMYSYVPLERPESISSPGSSSFGRLLGTSTLRLGTRRSPRDSAWLWAGKRLRGCVLYLGPTRVFPPNPLCWSNLTVGNHTKCWFVSQTSAKKGQCSYRRLWIDAICLNQRDPNEKRVQVALTLLRLFIHVSLLLPRCQILRDGNLKEGAAEVVYCGKDLLA